MKTFLKQIISNRKISREFYGIIDYQENIGERLYLKLSFPIDISHSHCIINQTPFKILIWGFPNGSLESGTVIPFHVNVSDNRVAKGKLCVKDILIIDGSTFLIAEVTDTQYLRSTELEQQLFYYFLQKGKLSQREKKGYAVLYSYPRKVILVAFEDGDYYNLFPMDFQGASGNGYIFLGLRNTNITLPKMKHTGRLLVIEPGTMDFTTLYSLGKYHSSQPALKEDLPFQFRTSQLFRIPFPDSAASYKEVEILSITDQGSHSLIVGKTKNEVRRSAVKSMYHVHSFHYHKRYYKKFSDL